MSVYDSSNIKIYKDLEAVRKRPGMYIGNTDDGSGLHRMIFETLDNSVDESLSGYCDNIEINLLENRYVSVSDNGRGMPIDFFNNDKSAAEVIMTTLHAGAKFDNDSYNISSGLHGVGISVVNALSKELKLNISRSGFIHEQSYNYGKPVKNFLIIGHTEKKGTKIFFLFDSKIFKTHEFENDIIISRLKELSYLNPNIVINFKDFRKEFVFNKLFNNNNGIFSFIEDLNRNEIKINEDVIFISGKKKNISVNIILQWVESEKENILCYTNNIKQKDGGSHLAGFKIAVTKIFKTYIEYQLLKTKSKITIHGEDIRIGLTAIISIYMTNPKFTSQIKEKLISSEVKNIVEFVVSIHLKKYLYENPISSKSILNKIILSAKNKNALKEKKNNNKKIFDLEINQLIKLSDCQEKDPNKTELFIVEGDSAGGSAKQARDKKFQAILPLKGKILNVEKSSLYKMSLNTELKSIISVLKSNFLENSEKKENLKYNKIIFMTDADIDGSHIRTLLLTFFYRHMLWLVEKGHLYISKPPLYKFQKDNSFFYVKDKLEFNDFLFDQIFKELFNLIKKENSLLKNVIDLYKQILYLVDKMSIKFPKLFFEKLYLINYKKIKNWIYHENYLNNSKENNQKFKIRNNINKENFEFIFNKFGIKKTYKLEKVFFKSEDFYLIKNFRKLLKLLFAKIDKIIFLEEKYDFNNFNKLIDAIKKKIMKKYIIQRYKGLGEMNPDQLWETTMNPRTRNLYRIKIDDIKKADNIFVNLMGENISERKIYIEKYSGSILDLDI